MVIARDLATIRDLLVNANRSEQRLADNPEFRRAVERKGEVVYFSDLKSLVPEISKSPGFKVNESGALNIGNSSWENSHHFVFDESDWAKPFSRFTRRTFRRRAISSLFDDCLLPDES